MANLRKTKKALKRIKAPKKKTRASILWFPIALILVAYLCVPPALALMSNDIISITYVTLDEEKIDGEVRIALISDMHLKEFGKDNIELVKTIDMLDPDLIAICGDMSEKGNKNYTPIMTLCKQLVDIAPVYYAYGNREFHDILFEGSTLDKDLADIGVNVLSDTYCTVEVNGNLIDLGGLNEDPTQYEKYGKGFIDYYLTSPNMRVLLTHNPGHYDTRYKYEGAGSMIGTDIDVVMCGHRHGGQVVLPQRGGLYHPDVGLFPDFVEGVTEVEGTNVIVTRGLSADNDLPRINNPPEVVMVILN